MFYSKYGCKILLELLNTIKGAQRIVYYEYLEISDSKLLLEIPKAMQNDRIS